MLSLFILSVLNIAGCKTGGGGDPKEVLIRFFDALSKNNIEGARNLATKESKSLIDMMEMGMKMGKENNSMNKFDEGKMEFGKAIINGDKATIPVKEKTSGETLNYTLKKEDGSWKVAFDKSSMMQMGMEKMNEKGINPTDSIGRAMEELKNINIDSLRDNIKKGMESLDSANRELQKIKTP